MRAPGQSCCTGGQPTAILAQNAKKLKGNTAATSGANLQSDSPLLRFFTRSGGSSHSGTRLRPVQSAVVPVHSAEDSEEAVRGQRQHPSPPRRQRAVGEAAIPSYTGVGGSARHPSPSVPDTTWRQTRCLSPSAGTQRDADLSPIPTWIPSSVALLGPPGDSSAGENPTVSPLLTELPVTIFAPLKGQSRHFHYRETDSPHSEGAWCSFPPALTSVAKSFPDKGETLCAIPAGTLSAECCLPVTLSDTGSDTHRVMPPKSQRPPPGPKKAPATPASKSSNWSVLPADDKGPTPSLSTQTAGGAAWGSSSESLVGDPVLEDKGERLDPNWRSYVRHLPTKEDFKNLLAEVKDTCRTAIASIRQDLTTITNRVDALEETHDSTKSYVMELQQHSSASVRALRETRRHLEDLDNRGRRNNIRIRGLPEAEGQEDLQVILESIFNNLRELPLSTPIKLDRVHRAIRPKNASSQPRDVICCVHDYGIKEAIMAKARTQRHVDFEGSQLQLYPDLSWLTLQKRRCLKPLLTVLKDNDLSYRWGFPFALLVTRNGRSHVLRSYEDLPTFCSSLNIPVPDMADWEIEVPPPAPPDDWQRVTGRKKRRSSPPIPSPQQSPAHRSADGT